MQRLLVGVIVVALVAAAAIVVASLGLPLGNHDSDPIAVRWTALGDSYSSGLGEIDSPQECARDVQASYVGRAADLLRKNGYEITLQFAACAGAMLDDLFTAQSSTTLPQADVVDETADIVTLTFGGDDLGFGSVVSSCVVNHYARLIATALGTDTSIGRECVVDADNPVNRGSGDDSWSGIEDELTAGLRELLKRMPPSGRIFVLSYPLVFANPDRWPTVSCFGFSADNARSFNLAVIRMGEATNNAVARAREDAARVHFVDWREHSSEKNVWADHGLCGTETPWVHGIRILEPGGLTTSPANSFHPTAAGYVHAADLLAKAIEKTTKK